MEASVSIIHRGVVDCWPRESRGGLPNTTIEAFREGTANIFAERDRIKGSMPLIIVGIAPTNDHMLKKFPKINAEISKYNSILKEFAGPNVHYVDMEHAINNDGFDLLHPDGHHLSKLGHEHLAKELRRLILPIARKQEHQLAV